MSPVFATRLATKAIVPRAQRRLVVEVHAESRVDAGRQHVILVNSVTHFQCRSRRLAACHCRAALQGCDLTDGIVGSLACSCILSVSMQKTHAASLPSPDFRTAS